MADFIKKDGVIYLALKAFCERNGLKAHNSALYNKWTHTKKRARELGYDNLSYKQRVLLDSVINPKEERGIFIREDYLDLLENVPFRKELEEIYFKLTDECKIGDFQIANRIYSVYPLGRTATLANTNEYRHAMAVVNYFREFAFSNDKKNEALYHAMVDLYNKLKSGKNIEELIERKPRITKAEKAKEIIKYFLCEIWDSGSEVSEAVSDRDFQKLQEYRNIIQALDMRYIKADIISAIDNELIEAMSEAQDKFKPLDKNDDIIDYNDRFK